MRFVLLSLVFATLPFSVFAQVVEPSYHLNAQNQEKLRAMNPAEREAIVNQAKQKWQNMGAEDQQTMKEQATSEFNALSPAEQEALKSEALQKWQSMTPQERQELQNSFPDMLRGNLETGQ